MQFTEIADRVVDDARLIHKSDKLAKWIQCQIESIHGKQIARYVRTDDSRFFSALVLGVYGGDPQWAELTVSDPNKELNEQEEERVNATIGVLILTGKEQLFPIDGQHRIAGIKRAVAAQPDLGSEEVTVILVGHSKSDDGMKRTRRLFVTLNQRAKKVSDKDIVALDEDNGLAVVTRRIIDEEELFQRPELISDSATVAITESDKNAVTSILGIYQILKAIYPREKDYRPTFARVKQTRPKDSEIDAIYAYFLRYWKTLIAKVPEYKRVIQQGNKKAEYYRSDERNHLLFRPAGQQAFARATECLVSRGKDLDVAVGLLVQNNNFDLFDSIWHSILWDPEHRTMEKHVSLAETVLLTSAGQEPRSPEAKEKLDQIRTRGIGTN